MGKLQRWNQQDGEIDETGEMREESRMTLRFQTRIPKTIVKSLVEIRNRSGFQGEGEKCHCNRWLLGLLTTPFLPFLQVFIQQNVIACVVWCVQRKHCCVGFSYYELCWVFKSPRVREKFKGNGNEVCRVF